MRVNALNDPQWGMTLGELASGWSSRYKRKFIPKGAAIYNILPGSPAENAGFHFNSYGTDVITSVEGLPVRSVGECVNALTKHKGQTIKIVYFTYGESRPIKKP